ncbi:potassium channel protein [Aliidiomarina minuta]|uniref:Potassium channel protein n=2 Tax=Aliidiomarina minuta TaxID=880057 RepID=A0A432W3Z1_9GAMM|nr:potassium channel protein [Aliidiomarina minuta]
MYRYLEPAAWQGDGMSPVNLLVAALVVVASIIAIAETEAILASRYAEQFFMTELALFCIFLIEYCLRVYAAGEDPRYKGVTGRIRYIFSFWALIDLLALLPFIFYAGDHSGFFLRFLKVLRLLRIARLGRFSQAWDAFVHALGDRRYELMLSVMLALLMLIISSSMLYAVEAPYQPEAFGSIPRAFWWSVATLTTVGYGDVTPITAIGKLFAGMTAIAGIGLIAMPTGIMAAAFSDAFQVAKEKADEKRRLAESNNISE